MSKEGGQDWPEPVDLPKDPTAEPTPGNEHTSADQPQVRPDPAPAEPREPEAPAEEKRAGRIREQDPETAVPREPTLAERRAREVAERRAEEAEEQRRAEEEKRRKSRKRIMIGGGAVAGVAALIAIGYAASGPDEVEALCTDDQGVIAPEENCVQPAAAGTTPTGGYYGGGFFPIFIGGGGRQYHYTYGGQGQVGQPVRGGTTVAPSNATVKTQSGRTISRGGFGVSGKSGGSGGSGGS